MYLSLTNFRVFFLSPINLVFSFCRVQKLAVNMWTLSFPIWLVIESFTMFNQFTSSVQKLVFFVNTSSQGISSMYRDRNHSPSSIFCIHLTLTKKWVGTASLFSFKFMSLSIDFKTEFLSRIVVTPFIGAVEVPHFWTLENFLTSLYRSFTFPQFSKSCFESTTTMSFIVNLPELQSCSSQ